MVVDVSELQKTQTKPPQETPSALEEERPLLLRRLTGPVIRGYNWGPHNTLIREARAPSPPISQGTKGEKKEIYIRIPTMVPLNPHNSGMAAECRGHGDPPHGGSPHHKRSVHVSFWFLSATPPPRSSDFISIYSL